MLVTITIFFGLNRINLSYIEGGKYLNDQKNTFTRVESTMTMSGKMQMLALLSTMFTCS